MYHGIIIDQEFKNPSFPLGFKTFNKKVAGTWKLYGIELNDEEINSAVSKIQENLKDNEPWYAHLYNNKELIIIFKEKVFYVKQDSSTWKEAIRFGGKINIPREQLDFHPSHFDEEKNYFS